MVSKCWCLIIITVFAWPYYINAQCIIPPPICPNENVTFWLYTRDTQHSPYELSVSRPETIDNAVFVAGNEFKFLLHGYTGHRDYDPNIDSRPAYFKVRDVNIISIDYGPLVRDGCYFQAVANVPLVSRCAAQLIDTVVARRGIPLSNFHVVGLSLGAHVSGGISNWLQSGKLDRITGLDPALPLFATFDRKEKLDRTDANFVDIIHTDALQRGKLEYLGHLDHFVNGGRNQKGCEQYKNMTMSECSHWRSALYFAESIVTPIEKGFYGRECWSWFAYIFGFCPKDAPEILMGEYATKPSKNTLAFVDTNPNPPYARGRSSSTKDKWHYSNEVYNQDNSIIPILASSPYHPLPLDWQNIIPILNLQYYKHTPLMNLVHKKF